MIAAATAFLVVALLVSVLAAISLGSAVIPFSATARFLWAALTGGTISVEEVTQYQIVWQVRTPRVVLAAVVGAGLSAVGVAVQAMVRNALADPFILGVSSGASVGAVSVTVFGGLAGFGVYAVSVGAFAGALVASALVYLAARSANGVTPLRLVLTGVALAFGFEALMSVIVYFAPDSEATSTVLYWTMGSFGAATWGSLPVVTAVVVLAVVALRWTARGLDVLSFGDESAASLGVDADRLRGRLFVITAVATGAMVATSGAIGFVGLVVPHLVRIVVGAGHARVLVIAPLFGAVFVVWVDLVSRVVVAPRELPLGVITALVGVPVFITLMRRRGYLFGGR
ncbi:FecCD family ABC transporter permease [Umezawaea beigongshangensis]|uniref:FecCD family ABC transporter permease n=1 Tax=Umezawaea beigongshangensis TaxID=2780383 RepID=UPI0027DBAF82|nr:iron ABC transporter permease [Umezawaea beigongshangensis]